MTTAMRLNLVADSLNELKLPCHVQAVREAASEIEALQKEVERWKQSYQSEAKRDGKWLDEWGACRVCGGEIPHGHTQTCDFHKEQMENRTLRARVAELRDACVQFIAWFHVDPFKGDKHWQELPDIVRKAEKAIAQPEAAKPSASTTGIDDG